jgi:hypothetical protein
MTEAAGEKRGSHSVTEDVQHCKQGTRTIRRPTRPHFADVCQETRW